MLFDGRLISGEPDSEIQSVDFLKKFRQHMRATGTTDDAGKIEAFGDHLITDSPAEKWYKSYMTTNPKGTFASLDSAFITRFPSIQKVAQTSIDYQRELLALRLEIGMLGKKEKFGGVELWSHQAFAQKALSLAKLAGIDTGTSCIFNVRDELPEIIRDKVSESHTSWVSFTDAIRNMDLTYIRDGVRKFEEAKKKEELSNARLQRLERATPSPSASVSKLTAQMSKTRITTASPAPTTANQPRTAEGGTSRTTWSSQTYVSMTNSCRSDLMHQDRQLTVTDNSRSPTIHGHRQFTVSAKKGSI